jgi:hypothetical protein
LREDELRTHYVKVSLNLAEWQIVAEAKLRAKTATWIRESILFAASSRIQPPVVVKPETRSDTEKALLAELVALRLQVAGLGRNCNQIAKSLNSGGVFSVQALTTLISLDRQTHEIKSKLAMIEGTYCDRQTE